MKPLRLGVLGAAHIARAFCSGIADSDAVSVVAVASRDREKSRAFAAEFGIECSYGSYDDLLASPDVDAVYIPLPNALHTEWSARAARAGKHALCEKPIAASFDEARRLFQTARECGVQVVEAFPYRAQAQTKTMLDWIHSGRIGTVTCVQAVFTFVLSVDKDIRWQPELAGGALMDVGCYPVSLITAIKRVAPIRVSASAEWHGSGVDRTLVGTLEYPDGMLAQIACGFRGAHTRYAHIIGTRGAIQTTFYNHPPQDGQGAFQVHRAEKGDPDVVSVPATNGFLAEAEAFARLVKEGPESWPGPSAEESCENTLILESLLESARTRRVIPLEEQPSGRECG